MKRLTIDIHDEGKVETLLKLLRDLPYVDAWEDDGLKKWSGHLPEPIHVENFMMFSREELHER